MNIPIYRAKKIDSDEYVEGYLLQDCFGFYIIPTNYALRCETLNNKSIEIDSTTLSIHFPDMIDSQGSKIFASLQEDGKGGNIIKLKYGSEEEMKCVMIKDMASYRDIDNRTHWHHYYTNIEIIGVKK